MSPPFQEPETKGSNISECSWIASFDDVLRISQSGMEGRFNIRFSLPYQIISYEFETADLGVPGQSTAEVAEVHALPR